MAQGFSFRIEKKLPNRLGRAGTLSTPHGVIHTPAFVPVATKATVKAVTPDEVRGLGAEVVLANTYHLYLEPGEEVVKRSGGLGTFMHWPGPTMTDSGGFQVFSLGAAFGRKRSKIAAGRPSADEHAPRVAAASLTRPHLQHPYKLENVGVSSEGEGGRRGATAAIDDDGVTFRSPRNGSTHRFTPERSIDIQRDLGADIIFAFDECASPEAPYEYQKKALARTHAWAERSLRRHKKQFSHSRELENNNEQALFGIVQGGRFEDLRKKSASAIARMEFDGFGIGGSFEKKDIDTVVGWVNALLPEEKPRHLLGIGEPVDLFGAVENGCDLFDCVLPTRLARNGSLYTGGGRLNIENARFANDFSPIEEGCDCYTCRNFTKSYLTHLFRARELLGYTLASIHNLFFIVSLVKRMRAAILSGTFSRCKEDFFSRYGKMP